MRKALILAVLLAIVAMPMAFAGAGFCRSMPCCPPHPAAQLDSLHQPDCCNSASCDQPPAASGEYTTAKHIDHQTAAPAFAPFTILPAILSAGIPHAAWEAPPPAAPPSLQRRIALLSTLLV